MKLFTIIIIGLILLGSIGELNGQTKMSNIGIEGGPGLSILYANAGLYSKSGFSIGGLVGVFYQYDLTGTFSIKTCLNYERKGTQIKGNSDMLNSSNDYFSAFDYLSIPILFKANYGKHVKFFIDAGPWFAYLLNQTLYYRPEGGKLTKSGNEKDSYLPYDAGVLLGIGMTIPIKNHFLISIELRDDLGLINIRKSGIHWEDEIYFTDNPIKAHTNLTSILFSFGYRLGNKIK